MKSRIEHECINIKLTTIKRKKNKERKGRKNRN